MSQLLVFRGGQPFNKRKIESLAQRLEVSELHAVYEYHVALREGLDKGLPTPEDVKALNDGLTGGPQALDSIPPSSLDHTLKVYYVAPRAISPWSSNATNIVHVWGFQNIVKRVERLIRITIRSGAFDEALASDILFDRMTQTIIEADGGNFPNPYRLFKEVVPARPQEIKLTNTANDAMSVLEETNKTMKLSLDRSEIEYLVESYAKIGRNPIDAELFMFAHKQFNASWTIDGDEQPQSLFSMIRSTHASNPKYVVSAYSDNAAVMKGHEGSFLSPSHANGEYGVVAEPIYNVIKVETHNHPTAISPWPGAATGAGGEIRDEGSVGRGSSPQAGICGFSVSDLHIPGHEQTWELDIGKPSHIASSLKIMLDGPLGSANYNNEFGRPVLTGFFRTLTMELPIGNGKHEIRGYHKPILIAGGIGTVRPQFSLKNPDIVPSGSLIIVLGGPSMLIGLGGGSASSSASAEGSADLDFASVQRDNAEVQRRAQEVINACTSMGNDNPVLFIHDVGAGGLSNAIPELVHDIGMGGKFELREIDNVGCSTAMEIWCNEAQERYVLAIAREKLETFKSLADRERCKFSVVGEAVKAQPREDRLELTDRAFGGEKPIDLPIDVVFSKPPKIHRTVQSRKLCPPSFDAGLTNYLPNERNLFDLAVRRVMGLPSVASKMFLITIGDRTVGGLVARDQLVGPWQVPVADVGVTATCFKKGIRTGTATAIGEKPGIALINPGASARMAVAEALCNMAAADVLLDRIRLSANWMSAIHHPGEGAALYEAVEAVTALCKELRISIPVGKDSTSMKMSWQDKERKEAKEVVAPLSLVISAFSPVRNILRTWTPQLRRPEEDGIGETVLFVVDLAEGHNALGGSALAQVFGQIGNETPDVRNAQLLQDFFYAIEEAHNSNVVLAYHDAGSDGGIFTAIVEMMFAGRCGASLLLENACRNETADIISTLFTEELAAVFQIRKKDEINFKRCFANCGPPPGMIKKIGTVTSHQELSIYHSADPASLIYRTRRSDLQKLWASTSHHMQSIRDNPDCADAEYKMIEADSDPGLSYNLTFDPAEPVHGKGFLNAAPSLASDLLQSLSLKQKPRVCILREQGVNGAKEMAYAFMNAGFIAEDVHMTDLIHGRKSLTSFVGLAACGGFSYGDVLGAGRGWALSVALNPQLRQQFKSFLERPDTFTIGVCNGCQFLTQLALVGIIPNTAGWPTFQRNESDSFEARFSMVEVLDNPSSPSVFLHGMKGSKLPIAVSHGEGRASFPDSPDQKLAAQGLLDKGMVSLRYVDNHLKPTEAYPSNPNGSPLGIAGLMSGDGRVLATMPHPERLVMAGIGSWIPDGKAEAWEEGPWGRLFKSARRWVG